MKNIILKRVFILAICLSPLHILAQNTVITGKVTEAESDSPIPGVNILIKGTNQGTTTDRDGNYTLTIPENRDILIFSFIGYETEEVKVQNRLVVNISLNPSITSLQEIVVVGYGQQTKKSLTGAISSVSSEDITALPVGRIDQALEGRAPGVQVRGGGSPGEEVQVTIRGLSTFGNSQPLYVVDGVFVESISQINPASIDRMDVLKDAAAAAIYGSRASNGVVLITTKTGKIGRPKITFNAFAGTQYLPDSKYRDVITGDQLVAIANVEDASVNGGIGGETTPTRILEPDFRSANTDWQPLIYQTAPIQSYDLGITGGNETARYSVFAGIFDQEGIQIETGLTRYTFNVNSEFDVSDKVRFGQTLNVGYSEFSRPEVGRGRSVQEWSYFAVPYLPAQLPDGRFVNADRDLDGGTNPVDNPLLIQATQDNEERKTSLIGSFYGEVELLKGLTNRFQIGVDLYYQTIENQQDRFGEETVVGDGSVALKTINQNRDQVVNTTINNVLTYNRNFNLDHDLELTGLIERTDRTLERLNVREISNVSNAVSEINANSGLIVLTQEFPETRYSYAFRAGYGFKDKYLFSGSIRRDCSSKFGVPCETFSGASLGWVLTEEGFLRNSNILSNLKVKGSIGTTGNDNIPPFSTDAVLSANFNYSIDGQPAPGTSINTQPVENLQWETTTNRNIGVEASLLDNQIEFTAEYFNNTSSRLLTVVPLTPSSGLPNNPIDNAAAIDTKGLEFTLGYNYVSSTDFKLNFWGSYSTADITVDKTDNEGTPLRSNIINSFRGENLTLIAPGSPLFGIDGFLTDGLFTDLNDLLTAPTQNQQFFVLNDDGTFGDALIRTFDASGSPIFTTSDGNIVPIESVGVDGVIGTALGDIKFKDINGDGVINSDDKVVIADPNPDFVYSFNLSASYKGFDISIFGSGVQGVEVLNAVASQSRVFFGLRSFDTEILNRYTPENTNTNVPRYAANDPGENGRISDRYIEDGSYFRLKNITIGYTLPADRLASFMQGVFKKVRVYASSQNLLTITKYTGLDPEIRPFYNAAGIGGLGIDQGFSPAPTTFIGGIQLEF